MKRSILAAGLLTITTFSVLTFACNKSTTTASSNITCDGSTTYTATAKTIITSNCATSGCHASGSSNGDFSTYAGLKPYLSNGSFYQEVITTKNMPRGFSLSTDNYNALYCWANNNYAQ